jgi:putative ATPase
VPLDPRNAVTGFNRAIGYGNDYRYPHDYAGNVVDQSHLPDQLARRRYYNPCDNPREQASSECLQARRQQAPADRAAALTAPHE